MDVYPIILRIDAALSELAEFQVALPKNQPDAGPE